MINCPHCQTPNRAAARFCMGCGARLAADPLSGADPTSAAPADNAALPVDASASPLEALSSSLEALSPPIPSIETVATLPQDSDQALASTAADLPGDPRLPVEPVDSSADANLTAPVSQVEPANIPTDADLAASVAPVEPGAEASGGLLAVGTVIGERFTITGLLEQDPAGYIYTAADSHVCGQCGAAVELGDQYCGSCGVLLPNPAAVVLRESAAAPETSDAAFEVGGVWYAVLPGDTETSQPSQVKTGWRLQVGQASDNGRLRELDEDSVFSLVLSGIFESQIETTVGLFIVADGIGGHEGGEVASKLAVQTMAQQVLQRIIWPILQGDALLPETLQAELEQSVQIANRQVYELRRERSSDMGTTLTMALVINGQTIIGNVGDSRTYVWGPDGLEQLTTDHSLIAALIAAGQEPPEAIYTHPQRNLITRSLGDRPQVEIDLFSLELEAGFRLILCCDGVWEMIRDEGIEEIMLQEDYPQRAADKIVQQSNNAGGEDNISVVVVAVEQV